jgi:HAD superfamily phosphatase (TIGR01668 family)
MVRQLLMPDWAPGCALPQLLLDDLQDRAAHGIRALVIDVDRTLLPRRSSDLPQAAEQWLRQAGARMPIHLFSNNPSRQRIGRVSEILGFPYTVSAAKPRRGALRRVIQELQVPADQVALLGDRVFTDVLAGNRLGLFTVLVKPIDSRGLPHPNDRLQMWELGLAHRLAHPLWERWL